jgi:hypothetical protein
MSTRIFLGVKSGLRLRLTTSPPFVSRLSRKCGNLDVSQLYKPPWLLTGIVLPYIYSEGLYRTPHTSPERSRVSCAFTDVTLVEFYCRHPRSHEMGVIYLNTNPTEFYYTIKNKPCSLNPRASYTDLATGACPRN